MRGKAKQRGVSFRFCGITPAYAGKRALPCRWPYRRRDHPRVCGEKCGLYLILLGITGSPPRMRGKVMGRACTCTRAGITPAYAGKRLGLCFFDGGREDHPRVCGEKATSQTKTEQVKGSPPRMRGKGENAATKAPATGITPAYAGKRFGPNLRTCSQRDHPRVCGEKPRNGGYFKMDPGSPPRMRGKASQLS